MKFENFRISAVTLMLALAVFAQLGFAASLPMPMPNIASGMSQNLQLSTLHYSYNGGLTQPKMITAVIKSKNAALVSSQPSVNNYQAYTVIGTPSTNLSIALQQQAALSHSVSSGTTSPQQLSSYVAGSTDIFGPMTVITTAKSTTIHRVIFAVYTNQMATDLTTTLKPYVQSTDVFDLVSGNNGGTLNVSRVLSWANTLHAAYPNSIIVAHTAGLKNYANLTKGVSGSVIKGVLYDYEPNMANEPGFSWNFTTTLSNFKQAKILANTYGLTSIAYPTGRAMEESDLQKYGWNYAMIAQNSNRLVIQSQTDCHSSVTKFSNAVTSVVTDYATASVSTMPAFQVTIGGGGVNAVGPKQAYNCTGVLTSTGFKTVYLWWSTGSVTQLESYLTSIGR